MKAVEQNTDEHHDESPNTTVQVCSGYCISMQGLLMCSMVLIAIFAAYIYVYMYIYIYILSICVDIANRLPSDCHLPPRTGNIQPTIVHQSIQSSQSRCLFRTSTCRACMLYQHKAGSMVHKNYLSTKPITGNRYIYIYIYINNIYH